MFSNKYLYTFHSLYWPQPNLLSRNDYASCVRTWCKHIIMGDIFLFYKYAASTPCRSWCPRGVCRRYRIFVIIVSHDVTEIFIAFIDVHTHRYKSVAVVVSLQFGGKDTNKKWESLKRMRISSLFCIISLIYILLFHPIRHISLLSVPVIWLCARNAVLLHPNLI